MSKHTPGPWFAVNRGTKKEPMMSVMAARIAGQKPGHEVAMCATGDSSQEMENANAALIAKAPEMFEVLREIVNGWERSYGLVASDLIERAEKLVGGAA